MMLVTTEVGRRMRVNSDRIGSVVSSENDFLRVQLILAQSTQSLSLRNKFVSGSKYLATTSLRKQSQG